MAPFVFVTINKDTLLQKTSLLSRLFSSFSSAAKPSDQRLLDVVLVVLVVGVGGPFQSAMYGTVFWGVKKVNSFSSSIQSSSLYTLLLKKFVPFNSSFQKVFLFTNLFNNTS